MFMNSVCIDILSTVATISNQMIFDETHDIKRQLEPDRRKVIFTCKNFYRLRQGNNNTPAVYYTLTV